MLPRQNERGEQELIGYVVPRAERSLSSRELREFAAQRLPTYMVPQAILILEKMPLTRQRQDQSQGAPAARRSPGHGAPELCRSGHPHPRDHRRDLERAAQTRQARHSRRLL